MQEEQGHHKLRRYIEWALVILGIILATLLVVLVFQSRGILQPHSSFLLRSHGPLAPSDAAVVRPWMTFDYINKLFALPPDYLRTQLGIGDARYPRLTIGGYAKSAKLDASAFLNSVEAAIQSYSPSMLSPVSTTTTAL